ncbi:MAG: hypothetical protein ACO3XO_05900 [Bdellovibrionota bacterium]
MGIIEDIKNAGKELVDKVKKGLQELGDAVDEAIQGESEEPVPVPVKGEGSESHRHVALLPLSEFTLFGEKK